MDLNLNALIDMTYLVPIAITLRKVYAPAFDLPEPIVAALRRLDQPRMVPASMMRPASQRGFEMRA